MREATKKRLLDLTETGFMAAILTGLGYLVVMILSAIVLHITSIEDEEPICRSEVGGRVKCHD